MGEEPKSPADERTPEAASHLEYAPQKQRAEARAFGFVQSDRAVGLTAGAFFSVCFLIQALLGESTPISVLSVVYLGAATLDAKRPWVRAVWAWLGMVPAWLYYHWFILDITAIGFPFVPFILASYAAIAVWLIARLYKRHSTLAVLSAPVIWCATEYLRGEIVLGGYSLWFVGMPAINAGPGKVLASAIGAYGVSGLIAGIGLALGMWSPSWLRAKVSGNRFAKYYVAVLCALLISAELMLPSTPVQPSATGYLKAAAVQTNLPQDNKKSWPMADRLAAFEQWIGFTERLAGWHPDVIAWPETMFPGHSLSAEVVKADREKGLSIKVVKGGVESRLLLTEFYDRLMDVSRRIATPLLIGSEGHEGYRIIEADGKIKLEQDRRFNSVFLLQNGQVQSERYDKRRLMTFGEYIPLARYFSGFQKWLGQVGVGAEGMSFDLAFGQNATIFNIPRTRAGQPVEPVRVVTPICFEVTYPEAVRSLVYQNGRRAADAIITVSNDGWFGNQDSGRRAHLLLAQWRCAELGVPMLRSVNTGISAAIDGRGQIITTALEGVPSGQSTARTAGILIADLPLPPKDWEGTIYGRIGDVWPIGCTVITGVLVVVSFWPARKGKASGSVAGLKS